jgi:hypothetical protein
MELGETVFAHITEFNDDAATPLYFLEIDFD